MPDSVLRTIIQSCISLDKMAARIYLDFSGSAEDPPLKEFWREMSHEENRHVSYWNRLLEVSETTALPVVFEEPEKIVEDLERIREKTDALMQQGRQTFDRNTSFLVALRLEFYLMHPVFETLFQLMKQQTGDDTAETDYAEHIHRFVAATRRFGIESEELEFISEIIKRLWEDNRELALQIARVKRLKGMMPICASCKKIRDDKGYWSQVEAYISEHSDAEFTHSICPECRDRLYRDVPDEPRSPGTGKGPL